MNGRFYPSASNCDCNAIRGVGQATWLGEGIGEGAASGIGGGIGSGLGSASGGFLSSIGHFFSSDFGSGLWKAGLGIGGAYALSQLTGGGGSHGSGGGGGSALPPAGGGAGGGGGSQPIIIQTQAPPSNELPSWVMPAAVVGGLGLVAALVLSRR